MAEPSEAVRRELWASRQAEAMARLAAVRSYLDAILVGAQTPKPGDLARASGLLLYAAGALIDADQLGEPSPQLDVPLPEPPAG